MSDDGGLPASCDLGALGIPDARGELLQRKHGNAVYRVVSDKRSYVLKWFGDAEDASEVRLYPLLQSHGVPTLRVHGRSEDALLLEVRATRSWPRELQRS